MEKNNIPVKLDNQELKKLFTSGSMPISYNYLAGNTEKAEEATPIIHSSDSEIDDGLDI